MQFDTPLRGLHEEFVQSESLRIASRVGARGPGLTGGPEFSVEWIPFGGPGDKAALCEIPGCFGSLEVEYAAIHRGAALVDECQRGVVTVRGTQRIDFLQRMLSNDVSVIQREGESCRAFLLNRKGRIEADILLFQRGEVVYCVVDLPRAVEVASQLNRYAVADDVEIADASSELFVFSVHGPGASQLLSGLGCRADELGVPGFTVVVQRAEACSVWRGMLARSAPSPDQVRRVRPVGWYAFNTARLEAGSPRFLIDFSTESLPHETGVLSSRVNFKKGCYVGQEVVARMQSRGQAKQKVVGLDIDGDLIPSAGEQVFSVFEGAMQDAVGVVTSSSLSPLHGGRPIAFASIRASAAAPGTILLVNAEGSQVNATIRTTLGVAS